MLADVVYGGREGTPWMQGSRFIGRGPTQITHRDNYAEVTRHLNLQYVALISAGVTGRAVDLVENPELLATDPELGVRSAFADYEIKKLSRWARQDDVDSVSATLNTGSHKRKSITNNLSGRRRWVRKARKVWPTGSLAVDTPTIVAEIAHSESVAAISTISRGSHGPAVEVAQRLLTTKGFAVGEIDGHYGPIMARAVAAFQDAYHLPNDGDLDADDMDALKNEAAPDLGDRATATDVPGSRQIAAGKAIQRATGTTVSATAVEVGADWLFGFSPFEFVMQTLERAGAVVSKASAISFSVEPKHVAIVVVCIAAPPAWVWARKIIAARIAAHQTINFTS